MARRRREWAEHITRMNAERLVKISRDNISLRERSPEISKRRMERLNPRLKQTELPITRKRRRRRRRRRRCNRRQHMAVSKSVITTKY